MTTVLIIVCIVFCIGVVFAIVSHMGYGIAADHGWRSRIHRHHNNSEDRQSRLTAK